MIDQPGFYYHPSNYSQDLGHPKLDIYLTGEPVHRFFDTKEVRFTVTDGERLSMITISHPWKGMSDLSVCAGRFWLYDHSGEVCEGYCLGGELNILTQGFSTSCHLKSPAPIFSLRQDPLTLDEVLIGEFEAQMAANKAAKWGNDDHGYNRQLAKADPLQLFASNLIALEKRLDEVPLPARRYERFQELSHLVREAIRLLKEANDWPALVPPLADLL